MGERRPCSTFRGYVHLWLRSEDDYRLAFGHGVIYEYCTWCTPLVPIQFYPRWSYSVRLVAGCVADDTG